LGRKTLVGATLVIGIGDPDPEQDFGIGDPDTEQDFAHLHRILKMGRALGR
jgi:hypothetical protein